MLDKIIKSCHYLLNNYQDAQECKSYLDERLNSKSQEEFEFGYFPNIKNISVLIDLVGESELRKLKLLNSREIEDSLSHRPQFWNHFESHPLIMPFRDAYGDVAGIVGRTLYPPQEWEKRKISKYKNTEFKKGNFVFGLYENKKAILDLNCVYIVEGQFDVIKASEIGFRNIVALGNNNMTAYQLSVISRYSDNIFLLLDNDEAGQRGRKQIINNYGQFANIRNFYLPDEYKDVDEYISKGKICKFEDVSFIVKD